MSASTLREAAEKLRGLAEGAKAETQWRVKGEPGNGYPSYDFIWRPGIDRRNTPVEVEEGAREFVSAMGDWEVPPTLTKRELAKTAWRESDERLVAMSSIVALALADWLDDAANSLDYEATETDAALAVLLAAYDPAFRVAEAILGPRA